MSELAIPKAKVVWWDVSDTYVRCPYCDKIHCHGFQAPRYSTRQYRVSHCGGPSYNLQFPLADSGDESWYEIDKKRVMFVTAGENPEDYFLALEAPRVLHNVSNRRKWTDCTEMVHMELDGVEAWDQKLIGFIKSHLVCGQVRQVRRYLETSPEKDIFLHGVNAWETSMVEPEPESDNDEDSRPSDIPADRTGSRKHVIVETTGETALILAATEENHSMVELLLEFKADPNVADMYGWTPLMAAALWGRRRNVEILLKAGAKKDLECTDKGHRRRAIDFARDLPENVEDRSHAGYKEDTYNRNLDRRYIVCLLGGVDEVGNHKEIRPIGFAFERSPTIKSLLSFFAHFDMPGQNKTIGVLWRGHDFPVKAAMSGWASVESGAVAQGVHLIDGRDYTSAVFELCKVVGHKLDSHDYDQGKAGQFYASHAEKQLVAYFVDRHLFLSADPQHDRLLSVLDQIPDLSRLRLADKSNVAVSFEEAKLAKLAKLAELAEAQPSASLKQAKIIVSRRVCPDCSCFITRVNASLGLQLSVLLSVA
ncbi:hypothetical protein MCOR30_011750 [Pyricularia oryzae]|nr:hypothetical protein MCOR30_011750 [Pyricularia oryzae]